MPRNEEHGEYWGSMHCDGSSRDVEWIEQPGCSARQGSVFQRKLRIVCERRCNNGWMSRVVDRAKPHVERMIFGQSFKLDRKNQTDLAAWIGVTTVIQEFANRLGRPRIPPEDRAVLMDTEAPPLSWSIWIARYVGEWWAPMGHYYIPMSYSKRPIDDGRTPPRGELQLTTFSLGELLVHVFTATQAKMIEAYRSYIGDAANPANPQQLWPIMGETLTWPTSCPFGDDEADSLAFDWVEQRCGARGLPGRPRERDALRLANWLATVLQEGHDK
jgi:hypothetical protein